MILVFLNEESEILLVMLWIRTRPASRIFPVKVKPVKIKPGKTNNHNYVTLANILVLMFETPIKVYLSNIWTQLSTKIFLLAGSKAICTRLPF